MERFHIDEATLLVRAPICLVVMFCAHTLSPYSKTRKTALHSSVEAWHDPPAKLHENKLFHMQKLASTDVRGFNTENRQGLKVHISITTPRFIPSLFPSIPVAGNWVGRRSIPPW